MDRQEIVRITMENMMRLYRDWATVADLIQQHFDNEHFEAIGSTRGIWGASTSYLDSQKWLYRSFARGYWKPVSPTRVAGYCMHFGEYDPALRAKLDARQVRLPAIAASVLALEVPITDAIKQPAIFNTLFRAGWYDVKHVQIADQVLSSDVTAGDGWLNAKAKTFFVDLLCLGNIDAVRSLVSGPLLGLYGEQAPAFIDPAVMRVSLTPEEEDEAEGQANVAGTQE